MKLSKRLKNFRVVKGFSMSEVSRKSEIAKDPRGKITQGYISRLESGKEDNPSLLKIRTLSRIYRVGVDELVG